MHKIQILKTFQYANDKHIIIKQLRRIQLRVTLFKTASAETIYLSAFKIA